MRDGNGQVWKPDSVVKEIVRVLRAGGHLELIQTISPKTTPCGLALKDHKGVEIRYYKNFAGRRLRALQERKVVVRSGTRYTLHKDFDNPPVTLKELRISRDQQNILNRMDEGCLLKTWMNPKTKRRVFMLVGKDNEEAGTRLYTTFSGNALLRKGLIEPHQFYKTQGYDNHIDGVEYAFCRKVLSPDICF